MKTIAAALLMLTVTAASWAQRVETRPSSQTSADIQVLSGGVGKKARDALARRAKDFSLKLVFATDSGAFLAKVPFHISAKGGKVLVDEVSEGPWAFVNLPAGSYTVKATLEGHERTRKVQLDGSGQKVARFRWPDSVMRTK